MSVDASLPLICIVDDNDGDRQIAEHALRRIRVPNPVRSFVSAMQFMDFVTNALSELDAEGRLAICLLFVDLRMPPPDGFELLKWIRMRPALSHVQIVVLTGSVEPRDMRRAAELHADLYLPKFPSDETLARVVTKATASVAQVLRVANLR